MDNGPSCSVRCLPNSWQRCLGVTGLSFLFRQPLGGKSRGLGDRLRVQLFFIFFSPHLVFKNVKQGGATNVTSDLLRRSREHIFPLCIPLSIQGEEKKQKQNVAFPIYLSVKLESRFKNPEIKNILQMSQLGLRLMLPLARLPQTSP